jgi:N-acetylmuramoyl-L-alanine amidase
MNITKVATPSFGGKFLQSPSLIVIHWTAGSSIESALNSWQKLAKAGKKVSAHFLIDREGLVVEAVPPDHIAFHAGRSNFEGRESCNDFSIGIELVNWGPLTKRANTTVSFFNWVGGLVDKRQVASVAEGLFHAYSDRQMIALISLIEHLATVCPTLTDVVGHSAISRSGKQDPGPLIDCQRLEFLLKDRA